MICKTFVFVKVYNVTEFFAHWDLHQSNENTVAQTEF